MSVLFPLDEGVQVLLQDCYGSFRHLYPFRQFLTVVGTDSVCDYGTDENEIKKRI